MNEEITLPADAVTGTAEEPVTQESETTAPEAGYEETETVVLIDYTPIIQEATLTICCAQFFCAFMIAGILLVFKIMGGKPHA